MRILRRYIAKYIVVSISVVMLALIGLQLFILFVNQLPDIGRGDFGLIEACKVVFYQLPYQIYLFFPMASLLGVLVGLGQMAKQRELVIMRAAGVSIGQISRAVLMIALVLMLFMSLLGESLVPKFTKYATDEKMQALTGGQAYRANQGVWFRQKNDFIFIGQVLSSRHLENIMQFHFDGAFQLKMMRHMNELDLIGSTWQASKVVQTSIEDKVIHTQHIETLPWEVFLEPSILNLSGVEADEMTLVQLHHYIQAHHLQKQSISQVELVFWQRLIQPFSTLVMMLLAIPFIFGPLRQSTIGAKMVMGACCGFVFYILNHFLGSASQVFQLSPIVAAIFPTCFFMLIGVILLRRVR